MSDPQPLPGRQKPRRAEPSQPDLPGSGDEQSTDAADVSPHVDSAAAAATPDEKGGADKSKQQSADALKNVRAGYD